MKKRCISFWLISYSCDKHIGNIHVSSRDGDIDLEDCRRYVRTSYDLTTTSGVVITGLFKISPATYRAEGRAP
jgi:hypothetical protein